MNVFFSFSKKKFDNTISKKGFDNIVMLFFPIHFYLKTKFSLMCLNF